jgi:DNA polymerase III epsilon subunit-like protein
MAHIYAIIDTETTGLTKHPDVDVSQQPKIIEFGGILTDGVNVLEKLNFICNPIVNGKPVILEPLITKITGLTNEDLSGEPEFKTYIPDLKNFLSKADVVIAHNMSFDRSLIFYEMIRMGLTLDDISFPKIQWCTVEFTMPQFGYRRKLIDLYNMYCPKAIQTHRADDDVLMLFEICKALNIFHVMV